MHDATNPVDTIQSMTASNQYSETEKPEPEIKIVNINEIIDSSPCNESLANAIIQLYSDMYNDTCQVLYCSDNSTSFGTFFEQFKCQQHDQYLYFLLNYIRTYKISLSKIDYERLTDYILNAIELENEEKFRWNYDALWCTINMLYYHDKCIPKPIPK